MTPGQLERIKAYIQRARYDSTYGIIKTPDNNPFGFVYTNVPDRDLVGQFIADAINEKLERMKPEQDKEELHRQKREFNWSLLSDEEKKTVAQVLKSMKEKGKPVITEHKPIQLKNLKDPE